MIPDVKDDVAKLKQARKGRRHITVDDLRSIRRSAGSFLHERDVYNHMKQVLIEYYSSPEGQEEIRNSIHREKSVEQIVEALLQEVHRWGSSGFSPGDPRGKQYGRK